MEHHELEDLSEYYLSSKKLSQSTIKSYRIVFKQYITYLKENNISYASTSDIIEYRELKREQGHSTYYIHIQISAIKGLYHYLKVNQSSLNLANEYAYDVMGPIKNEKIKTRIKKTILTIAQAKQLITYTRDSRKYIWDYRNHAIIYLMLTAGLKPIEIRKVKRSHYQMIDNKPVLYVPRNGNEKDISIVNLSNGASEALNTYLNKRKDNTPYLLVSHRNRSTETSLSRTFFDEMFKKVLEDAGLNNCGITPHSLRHTAATMNLLRGGSIEQTKMLMRHSNIKSTLVYAHHIERIKDDSEYQIDAYILKEDMIDLYEYFMQMLSL